VAVTRSDVARAAGVSPAVVSYVLNNGPRPVSTGARARVLEAVERLDYRPNAIASALRGGSTQTIGFLTPNRDNPFFAGLADALERWLSEQGYLVLTGSSRGFRAREERLLKTFLDRKVDGLIVSSGISLPGPTLAAVDPPVLVLDEVPDASSASAVVTEDALDARTTVEHLQHHGHALVGCIVGPPRIRSEAVRLAGWRSQQTLADAPAGDELVAFGEPSEEGGYLAAGLMFSEHGRPWAIHGRRPSALFVASDVQAIGALCALHELGLRVPDDVAVASMGGTRAAQYTIPTLTTMRQDTEYLAGVACAELLRRIRDPSGGPTVVRLRGNLVVGQTCGC
jgi:LacI family transcriptional regulator